MIRVNLSDAPVVWTVYRLACPAGLSYVGQTVQAFESRLRQHARGDARLPKLSRAIKSHGFSSFQTEILAIAKTKQEADALEKAHIARLDSFANGHNSCRGGAGHLRQFCKSGHDLDVVGRTDEGRCPTCVASYQKTAAYKQQQREAKALKAASDPVWAAAQRQHRLNRYRHDKAWRERFLEKSRDRQRKLAPELKAEKNRRARAKYNADPAYRAQVRARQREGYTRRRVVAQ